MIFEKRVIIKETDILLKSDSKACFKAAEADIKTSRFFIESCIANNPAFLASLVPIKLEELKEGVYAAGIIKKMVSAGKIADVGPMASVAGAIAESACKAMINAGAGSSIGENGGDIAAEKGNWTVGIDAGESSITRRLAFKLRNSELPLGICSSSGKYGHSISFGNATLAVAIARSAAVADASATSIANSVKLESDEHESCEKAIQLGLERADEIKEVAGCLVIAGDLIGKTGKIPELVYIGDTLKEY